MTARTDLDAYGPTKPCRRTPCQDGPAHLGGAHLDPTSDHYDGPDTTLRALPMACRKSAQHLMHTAREQGWDRVIVETALHELANEVHRLGHAVAAAHVDRDRGIRDAMLRSEDCTVHGADLRSERHQAYWFSVEADSLDQQRLAWLGAVYRITELVKGQDTALARTVAAIAKSASRSQESIRRRRAAPTFADCQRAGRCEHPDTTPHDACVPTPAVEDGA